MNNDKKEVTAHH